MQKGDFVEVKNKDSWNKKTRIGKIESITEQGQVLVEMVFAFDPEDLEVIS